MAKDNEPKNQPSQPSQPVEAPKPSVHKAPPEIKPDESTQMRFQGSEDIKENPNIVHLTDHNRRKK